MSRSRSKTPESPKILRLSELHINTSSSSSSGQLVDNRPQSEYKATSLSPLMEAVSTTTTPTAAIAPSETTHPSLDNEDVKSSSSSSSSSSSVGGRVVNERHQALRNQQQQFSQQTIQNTYASGKNRVLLNVGGTHFETTYATLTRYSSMFQGMLSGTFAVEQDPDGSIFIDRDGTLFHHILNFMRDGTLIVLSELSKGDLMVLLKEAEYYGLSPLVQLLQAKIKRQLERTRAELAHEKKYCLKRVASVAEVQQTFEDLTIFKGMDFESWMPVRDPMEVESYLILFSKRLTNGEMMLLERLSAT